MSTTSVPKTTPPTAVKARKETKAERRAKQAERARKAEAALDAAVVATGTHTTLALSPEAVAELTAALKTADPEVGKFICALMVNMYDKTAADNDDEDWETVEPEAYTEFVKKPFSDQYDELSSLLKEHAEDVAEDIV